MPKKACKSKIKPSPEAEYKKLVDDIRKIIDEAKTGGCEFQDRLDLLGCRYCHAIEYITADKGKRQILDENGRYLHDGQFLVISSRKRRYKSRQGYDTLNYTFICSECGTYQKAVGLCWFELF